MTPEEVLAEIADTLEQGWCQWRESENRNGKMHYCIGGAFNKLVYGRLHLDRHAMVSAWHALEKEMGIPPVIWNDTEGRTQEEVVTTIRNAKRHL